MPQQVAGVKIIRGSYTLYVSRSLVSTFRQKYHDHKNNATVLTFRTTHEFKNRRRKVNLEEIWTDLWVFVLEQSDVV